ncbi:hypothetical protein LVD17_23125 [Fulvivirga ulvae]|uniref:hypothetical protein n=1 Tax=Fulvivirga ulvae TaxID=2904245 RepID=UPI001F24EBB0|nr:hypothetical protein [Fulvivirga ulvae]UII31188.1 hypothetical protein LVD17_23125 [Fulvivirga ulvae]
MNIKDLIPDLLNLNGQKVNDKSLAIELISKKGATPSLALPAENFLFSAKAEGAFSLNLFNDANDHSIDSKIFEHWPEATSLYADKALLGYALEGKIKANAGAENLGKFDLGIDAEQLFKVKSFRIHDGNTSLKDAFTSDVSSFKFIFKKADVTSLKVNEAMAFEAAGRVALNAGVKVTDVYSGTASLVAGMLNLSGQVDLKLDASASVDFKIEIEDDFSVVIIRQAEDKFKVCINKVVKRTKELKAKAGVEAALGDKDKLNDLVDKFFEGVEEELFKYINDKISTTGLKEADLEKTLRAASLLNLTDISSVEEFKQKYEEKKGKVKEKLLEVITNKVAVGVAYDYNIIKTNESIFSGLFTKNAIEQFHGDIVKLRVADLVEAYSKDQSSFELTSYLKREATEITRSFGLNVAFGNFKLTSSIKKEFEEVTERKFLTESKLGLFGFKVDTYSRKRTKTYKHGKNSDIYMMNMDASMPIYVSKEEDLTAEKFDFGFGLSFDMTENKTSNKELLDIVDWAVTWDIIPQQQSSEVINKIKTEVLDKTDDPITYHCFLKVPQGEFDELIPYFKSSLKTLIPSALAASMLQVDYINIPVRNNMDLRREHYTAFWSNYLKSYSKNHPDTIPGIVAQELYNYFNDQNLSKLAMYEGGEGNYEAYNSAKTVEILEFNNVNVMVNSLVEHFDNLSKAINTHVHYEKKIFEKAFKGIDKTQFLKDFNLRFMGRLILDMNKLLAEPIEIEKGFNMTYKENGKDKTCVIA